MRPLHGSPPVLPASVSPSSWGTVAKGAAEGALSGPLAPRARGGDGGFLVQRDDLPRVPDTAWVPQEPPPSYEDVTGGGTQEEPQQK